MQTDHILNSLAEAKKALESVIQNPQTISSIQQAANLLIETFQAGGRVFSCGNGGSMSDAMHFAEELTGRFRRDRKALPATAISDPGHISCVANDFGYDFIFSRYLEAHAKENDCLLGISTSGESSNIIKAAQFAVDNGISVITLSGKPQSTLASLSNIDICTPGGDYSDRTQELHIKVIHILIELTERELFPENYQ